MVGWQTKSIAFGVVCIVLLCCTREDRTTVAGDVQVSDSVLNRHADSIFSASLLLAKQRRTDSAIALQERALQLRLSCRVQDVRLAYAYWYVAKLLVRLQKADAAEERISKALELADQFDAPRDSLVLMYLTAADIKGELTDHASALSLMQHARHLASDPPPSPVLMRRVMMMEAVANHREKRFDEAIKTHWKIIALLNKESDASTLATMHF